EEHRPDVVASHNKALDKLLHDYKITYVVLSGRAWIAHAARPDDKEGKASPTYEAASPTAWAQPLWFSPERWPFWSITGHALIFGWRDPDRSLDWLDPKRQKYHGIRWDPVELAFRPALPQPLPIPPAEDPQPPDFWRQFRETPPAP